jgi:DNA invertase Pin-like site-specific DNA recombinase
MQNAGMIYGYARVSTDAQDLTSQLAQLARSNGTPGFHA